MKIQYYKKIRWGLAPLTPNDAPLLPVLETVRNISFLTTILELYSEISLSRKMFGIGHMYIHTFLLRMTVTMTSFPPVSFCTIILKEVVLYKYWSKSQNSLINSLLKNIPIVIKLVSSLIQAERRDAIPVPPVCVLED
jgi:hypothetical protein